MSSAHVPASLALFGDFPGECLVAVFLALPGEG